MAENLAAAELEHELAQSLADRAAVSHDEDDVFVYSTTRQDAERAAEMAQSVAGQRGWKVSAEVAQWHPEAEEWKPPDNPLPSTPDELAAEHAERIEHERAESQEQGYPEFEVRVQCPSHSAAVQLDQRLHSEGISTLRRWRYLLIGSPDEDTAQTLAQRLRSELPPEATVTVEATARAASELAPANPFALFGGLGV